MLLKKYACRFAWASYHWLLQVSRQSTQIHRDLDGNLGLAPLEPAAGLSLTVMRLNTGLGLPECGSCGCLHNTVPDNSMIQRCVGADGEIHRHLDLLGHTAIGLGPCLRKETDTNQSGIELVEGNCYGELGLEDLDVVIWKGECYPAYDYSESSMCWLAGLQLLPG